MKRFDALIVDFGGVLTTPLSDAMVRFSDELGIELQDLVRVALAAYSGEEDALVTDFEMGKISEDAFSIEFAKRLHEATGVEVVPEKLVDRIFSGLEAEEDMFHAVIEARRAGYKTALLSNSWGVGLYPMHRFPEMFDVVVISGEVGMRKPDRDIFDHTVAELGVAADRCVFVDDHPGHLATAQELGMTTVLHRTPQRSLEELSEFLDLPLLDGAASGS